MRKTFLLLLISVFTISCSLPFTINWNTPTPEVALTTIAPATIATISVPTEIVPLPTEVQPTLPAFVGAEMNLGGIYMVVPPCLANSASGEIVPGIPYDENSGPMEYYPTHRLITFTGYPLSGKFFEAKLRVYPVAEFAAMNSMINDQVILLQFMIASQATLPDQSIPLLPVFNAGQVFRAKVQFMGFQNGQGVRFLTEYSQYYAPVNNYDLFYTFQGLSADGKYWVSATFPVNAAFLPENPNAPAPAGGIAVPLSSSATYESDMLAYYPLAVGALESAAGDAYTPVLNCLDQYIQSLQIGD
ncbi:MAG: hypothetical protein NTZ74_11210 [Chloroflexi bacterium]|nr:hypothetical protein [Chloroflexota bacterium]